MNRWIKRSFIGMAVVAALGVGALSAAAFYGDSKMKRSVELPIAAHDHAIPLREDSASIEHGRYLFQARGCMECHGEDGGGRLFLQDPKTGMRVAGPNISSAPESSVAHYQATDWARTLRHGVKPSGQPLMVMPSEDYARMSDEDLADLVAYIRQLPPVNGSERVMDLPVPVLALYGMGAIQDAAEKIDHSLPPQAAITAATSLEYGAYVGQTCKGCHGATLTGGKIPGSPPDWPAAANLTSGDGGALVRYADVTAFKTMMRSGLRPDGSAVSSVMPFPALSRMNDLDLEALYLYLQSLPAGPVGS
ncbi:MAG TPA: c-type cytochrome [Dongiaceae bacterium]|nr:c-type cytochrome [Dongiaceae bacterium]